MHTKLKLGLAALSLFALTGCDRELSGTLHVAKDLSMVGSDGKASVVAAGDHQAALNLGDKATELKTYDDKDGNEVVITMPLALKSQDGSFVVKAGDLKQSFGAQVKVSSTRGVMDTSHNESCILGYREEYSCSRYESVAMDPNGHQGGDNGSRGGDWTNPGSRHGEHDVNHGGSSDSHRNSGGGGGGGNVSHEPRCGYYSVAIYGTMYVQETSDLSQRSIAIDLVDEKSQEKLASFSSVDEISRHIITRAEGLCR